MAIYDNVKKVWISDTVLETVAKRVLAGDPFPNISKADWVMAAEARAEEVYKGEIIINGKRILNAHKFATAIGAFARRGDKGALVNEGDELAKLYYAASKASSATPDASYSQSKDEYLAGARRSRAEGDADDGNELDAGSPLADRRYPKTLTIEQARNLSPASQRGKQIDLRLRGMGDAALREQQSARGLTGVHATVINQRRSPMRAAGPASS